MSVSNQLVSAKPNHPSPLLRKKRNRAQVCEDISLGSKLVPTTPHPTHIDVQSTAADPGKKKRNVLLISSHPRYSAC